MTARCVDTASGSEEPTKRAGLKKRAAGQSSPRTNAMTKRRKERGQKPQRSFPMATICFYGPDDQTVTKIAVAIFLAKKAMEGSEMTIRR